MQKTLINSAVAILALICTSYRVAGQQIQAKEIGNNRYFFSDTTPYSPRLNWFLAYQYCRSIGMDLLGMPRQEEAQELMDHLQSIGKSDTSYWTSGNQLGSPMWIWMTSGQPFNTTFSYWSRRGPPLTKSQNSCMDLQGGIWSASNCMDDKAFICHLSRCYYFNYAITKRLSNTQGGTTSKVRPTKFVNRERISQIDASTRIPNPNSQPTSSQDTHQTSRPFMNKFSNRAEDNTEPTTDVIMKKFPGPTQDDRDHNTPRIFMNKFADPTNQNTDTTPVVMNKFAGPTNENTDTTPVIMNKFIGPNNENTDQTHIGLVMMNKFAGPENSNSDPNSPIMMNKFAGPGNLNSDPNSSPVMMNKFANPPTQGSPTTFHSNTNTNEDHNFGSRVRNQQQQTQHQSQSSILTNNFSHQNEIIPEELTSLSLELLPPLPSPIASFPEQNNNNQGPTTARRFSHPQTHNSKSILKPIRPRRNNERNAFRRLQRREEFSWAFGQNN